MSSFMNITKKISFTSDNLYTILSLNPYNRYDYSIETIRKAYKLQSKIFHPDKTKNNNSSTERFIIINKAYEILIDNENKKEYDMYLDYNEKDNIRKKTKEFNLKVRLEEKEKEARKFEDEQEKKSNIKTNIKYNQTYTSESYDINMYLMNKRTTNEEKYSRCSLYIRWDCKVFYYSKDMLKSVFNVYKYKLLGEGESEYYSDKTQSQSQSDIIEVYFKTENDSSCVIEFKSVEIVNFYIDLYTQSTLSNSRLSMFSDCLRNIFIELSRVSLKEYKEYKESSNNNKKRSEGRNNDDSHNKNSDDNEYYKDLIERLLYDTIKK